MVCEAKKTALAAAAKRVAAALPYKFDPTIIIAIITAIIEFIQNCQKPDPAPTPSALKKLARQRPARAHRLVARAVQKNMRGESQDDKDAMVDAILSEAAACSADVIAACCKEACCG